MSNDKTSPVLPPFILRLLLAWLAGGALYFTTLVLIDYDGFSTLVTAIIGGAIVSTVAVIVCAITGLFLLIPSVKNFWRATYIPALVLFAIGISLFIFGLLPGQIKTVGLDENGGGIKEVGLTWASGYLLAMFSIINFNYSSKSDSKSNAI
jgi:hypothetical protein